MWRFSYYITLLKTTPVTRTASGRSQSRYLPSEPSHSGVLPGTGDMYLVSEGQWVDGVLSCQRDAAQQDEEEDDICECCGIDDTVAQFTKPGERNVM